MEEPRRDHSAVEIAAAADEASNNSSSKPCIFEVPRRFKEKSPKSYIPESFSIGPLHYGKEHLKATEKIKKHYLDNLLYRKPTPRTTLEKFEKSILEVEGRARKCYAFPIDHLDKKEFVQMLVLDGCFIIELLRNNYHNYNINNTIDEDVPVFSVGWVLQDLYHDLILLENQIPWFILECLFDMTSEKRPGTKSLTELALGFFGTIFSEWPLPPIPDGIKSNHIVDLLRNSFVFSSGKEKETIGKWKLIPTAASLKASGITLKRGDSGKLLNINFYKEGVLEIPSLLIQETTCEAFRNLISYEQCYPNCKPKITSYAIFMKNLLSTTKDINVLCKADIIDNGLNPNDTLEFFKNIYTDTCVKEFYYAKIYQDVNENSYGLRRIFKAYMESYVRLFSDPIGFLSLFTGLVALYLTLMQTVFTVKQFYKDNMDPSPPPPPPPPS